MYKNVGFIIFFILLEHYYYSMESCFDYGEDNCPYYVFYSNYLELCYLDLDMCTAPPTLPTYRIYSCEDLIKLTFDIKPETCLEFPDCEPYGNNCRINKCLGLTKDDCKIKFLDDNKTLIKCQWVDDICLQEGREIKNCTQAENLTDLSEKQCSSLVTSGRCIKGPVGCKEIKDCSEINFEVEESICEEFTKDEEIKKCVSDIETKGCKQITKNC